MNVDLTAKIEGYDAFMALYKEGDEMQDYDGSSLLFYAMSNQKPLDRYKMVCFLLDKGADPCTLNPQRENLFHILFSRLFHNLDETRDMCERLIAAGVNVNQRDERGRVPLQYILNMRYSDDELEGLYDLWFSQPELCMDHVTVYGKTPRQLAELSGNRQKLVERMREYDLQKEEKVD